MGEVDRSLAEASSDALAREYLVGVAASVQEDDTPVQAATAQGNPPAAITVFVEAIEEDLIVMSTRGQSGLSRWLMGSVADRVVRGTNVPVLLVRSRK